jgi:hypothetical protein
LRPRRTIAIVSPHSKRVRDIRPQPSEAVMVQTTNRFFDEVARLMNDAAGVAQGVRREFETLFRTQAERWLRDLDLVKREEFEAALGKTGTGTTAAGNASPDQAPGGSTGPINPGSF